MGHMKKEPCLLENVNGKSINNPESAANVPIKADAIRARNHAGRHLSGIPKKAVTLQPKWSIVIAACGIPDLPDDRTYRISCTRRIAIDRITNAIAVSATIRLIGI